MPSGFGPLCLLLLVAMASPGIAENLVSLKQAKSVPVSRIQTRLKAKGKLLVGTGEEGRQLPLNVVGDLTFFEKSLKSRETGSSLAVRHYEIARANIAVGGQAQQTRLSETRRLIAVDQTDGLATFYSPLGPMTRDDLDLVSSQCDPLLVCQMLPTKKVKIGDDWRPADSVIAGAFGLDMVDTHEISCQLTAVKADSAVIEFVGSVEGRSLGAKSTLKIDGEFTFDRRRDQISRVSVTINEQREVGDFAPGFELEASVDSTITPADTPTELTTEKLDGMQLARTPGHTAIDFASPSTGLAFMHDRRWRVTLHRHDLLVLRMVEDGCFIAQCNISPVGPAVGDAEKEMAKFQGQVAQALSKHAGQIDEVSQARTESGVDIVRIAASGKSNDAPIRWVYYLLTDDSARRVAVVFTLPGRQAEQFATGDHDLIGGIRFLDAERAAHATRRGPR